MFKTAFTKGNTSQVGYIDSIKYNLVVQKLRNFFIQKGFIECHLQSRLSILAACEDVKTIATFDYLSKKYALPQTNQMNLEVELMEKPNVPGYFCTTTSYRQEPNPIPGRHQVIFPMFEIETSGNMDSMIFLWKELLLYLGYQNPVEIKYEDACKKYNTQFIEHEHEQMLYRDYGEAVLLTHFPMRTSPFWNMKTMIDNGEIVAKKVDVILSGQETIGSAERSCNNHEMRSNFYTISKGEYAKTLFDLFGKERVENELDDFFKLDFIERFGCGLGIHRLISSMEKEKKLCDLPFLSRSNDEQHSQNDCQ